MPRRVDVDECVRTWTSWIVDSVVEDTFSLQQVLMSMTRDAKQRHEYHENAAVSRSFASVLPPLLLVWTLASVM